MSAGVAALGRDAVKVLLHGNSVGRGLLGRRVVPLADDFHHVPRLAGGIEGLVDSVMPVGVDRGAGNAADFVFPLKTLDGITIPNLETWQLGNVFRVHAYWLVLAFAWLGWWFRGGPSLLGSGELGPGWPSL